jgi:ornithine cyclodeaminase/alanine dehydrogenase-like protein (mu-crystallin family)
VNAIGAYGPEMCELDAELLATSLLVVETEASALAEAGDVLQAIDAGRLPSHGFAHQLADVITGAVGRADDAAITVFKSVGLGVEDLIVAGAVARRLAGGGP